MPVQNRDDRDRKRRPFTLRQRTLIKLFLFAFFCQALVAQDASSLFRDLEIAAYWDQKLCERLPATFNHLFECGIFTTPTARMTDCGEIGLAAASVPPYLLYSVRVQPFSHLELSANYRIFRGIQDAGLSPHGYGDFSDREANAKLAFVLPEDTFNDLPGLAIGVQDFIGTKRFTTYYIVGTQVWINYGLETSLGWGTGNYTHGPSHGFFGGVQYFPFFSSCENKWIRGIGLSAEFDPINYKKDPHVGAHTTHSHINWGIKYQFKEILDLSLSYIRGDAVAAAASLRYNWGACEGFLAKVDDPLPYVAPRDTEPLGCYRPEAVMIDQLAFTLKDQGFHLTTAWIEDRCDGKHLWLRLMNECYRKEEHVKCRLAHLLAALTPSNIESVTVVIDCYGLPVQQYVFTQSLLFDYQNQLISGYEFDLLTPREEVCPGSDPVTEIFYDRFDLWRGRFSPRYESFLGSATGKYKYDVGIRAELEGFLPYDIYYELQVSYTLFSTTQDVSDFDFYNPSQLPNVLTDYVNYRKRRNFSTDKIYLQKNWNIGRGFFCKMAGGYLQVNYAGLAGELLYYPATANWAIGIEGAAFRKRRYTGLGFQDKLRQLRGYTPTYQSYFLLTQYFLSFYYDIPAWKVAGKIAAGGFLAYDKGFLFSLTRYFDSGLRISGWITMTNAHDSMHRENFYNKGIIVEVPFDLFFKCSSRRVWTHGMAEWLRDAGAQIPVGTPLFDCINRERRD